MESEKIADYLIYINIISNGYLGPIPDVRMHLVESLIYVPHTLTTWHWG